MNFDDLQSLWQKQPAPAAPDAVAIAATLRRVRADARAFERTILWRDLREIAASLLVFVIFADMARDHARTDVPTWSIALAWLGAALPLGVAGFMLFDRLRARRLRPRDAATVLSEIDRALAELRHQHRLLMSVTWWYLLPLAASGVLVVLHPVAMNAPSPLARVVLVSLGVIVLVSTNYVIRRLNHGCAQRKLAPQIAELERERREFSDFDSVSSSATPPPPQ